MASTSSQAVPQKTRPIYDEIVGLTDAFCAAHLNAEYAQVCRALAAKLSRKRPSPLETGHPNTWADAIVHIDVRYAPRAIQQAAFRKGLIPYIPGSADDAE